MAHGSICKIGVNGLDHDRKVGGTYIYGKGKKSILLYRMLQQKHKNMRIVGKKRINNYR
jgi:hypothetical protein